eukprot:GHVS01085022.1.p1 GENE.GHVS01085022.1~~GHVS01085022.1.p1  ORF type:complete len:321 (+),score=64.01 GHVS01085022.1:182-1144(+)
MPSSPLAPSYDRLVALRHETAEPLLKDNPARWVILPIKFPSVWSMFKKHEHDFWTAEQVVDQSGWTPADRPFQNVALRLIAAEVGSDMFSQMLEWVCGLLEHTTSPEARAFYGFECAFTTIHHEALAMLLAKAPLDAGLPDVQQQMGEIESVATTKKRDCISCLLNQKDLPFAEKLLIHAVIKSVMNATRCLLSAVLRANAQLPAVEAVLRRLTQTERLHCHFAALCYSLLSQHRLPVAYVGSVLEQCVEVEYLYAVDTLGVDGDNVFHIQKDDLKSYIQHVGDSVLSLFGGPDTSGTNVFAQMMKLDCCTVPPLVKKRS